MMSKSRIRFVGLAACLLMLVGGIGLNSVATRRSDAGETKKAKLTELLNEKLSLLQDEASEIDARHKAGFAGLEEVYEAHKAVESARFDLCDTDQERMMVMERMLDEAKQHEALLKRPGGAFPTRDVYKAQIDRLDIEIALERIKSK